MIKVLELRNRLIAHAGTDPLGFRLLCFVAALALVWINAEKIESFAAGLVDGIDESRHS